MNHQNKIRGSIFDVVAGALERQKAQKEFEAPYRALAFLLKGRTEISREGNQVFLSEGRTLVELLLGEYPTRGLLLGGYTLCTLSRDPVPDEEVSLWWEVHRLLAWLTEGL